jgi:hypothetical protein
MAEKRKGKIDDTKINFISDLAWGDIFYLNTDPDQKEYELVGIILVPDKTTPPVVKYRLTRMGEEPFEVFDFQVSSERDNVKVFTKPPDESDD